MKFPCLMIEALDIDGIRIDKATQLTVGYVADWANATRACARRFEKNNFYIPGEIVGGGEFLSFSLRLSLPSSSLPSRPSPPSLSPARADRFFSS